MNQTDRKPLGAARAVLVAAALVVVIAGMRAAAELLVPFLVSAFIALICAPPVFWLKRGGLPSGLAVATVVVGLLGLGTAVGTLVGTSLNDFYQAVPSYQSRLEEQRTTLLVWMGGWGIEVPDGILTDVVRPDQVMQLVGNVLSGLGGVVTNTLIIVLTVIFMLLEASSFPVKLRAALGDPKASFAHFDQITDNVNRYLAIKTWLSLATGVTAGIWVAILGVDFPVLWGLLAFLLNYVPNIGSIIAAVPPFLLALIQFGFGKALLVAVGFLVINSILGNVVEPRFMGRGLGLSTLVVFVSLVFWQWVLGPIGMLLSVPLTMALKIALESKEDTRWIAVFLGSGAAAAAAAQAQSEEEDTGTSATKAAATTEV